MIRTIYWENDTVVMIDQKALPLEETSVTCRNYRDVITAIKDLTIRGAPAIGIAAAMGIALGMLHQSASSREEFNNHFYGMCNEFAQARPTAVNLFWAIERMKKCFECVGTSDINDAKRALVDEAILIGDEDIAINRQMGINGRTLVTSGDTILTHCNAGALATGGYGTALGVVRAAHEEGKELHVFVDETRPVLQGARLTAWEMKKENIPATLITDNMAGFLMKQGKINLVIVGADRIAANGDVANKIGTYSLAILAKEHSVPFYIAAPLSTIDMALHSGDEIPIEERDKTEVSQFHGVRTAPEGVAVYNPAFDVTPHRYITAIITEAGIARPPYERSIRQLFEGKSKL
ncbi:MAG: S-methyl-5-thioribose-1-phosphate isomerase [Deltaproteobacteria bacterium]|nr:S-methyl-5-thioribose-1-phosphate isomerase [Deltaproteobacteria bacterium]